MPKTKKRGFDLQRHSRNSYTIRVPYKKRGDWEQWLLLTGDRHWDNPKSLQDLQRRHLDEALERGAPVIDIGDFFCAMQGKWDKRAEKADLRPEHRTGNYLDSLVSTASDFFAPYARNLTVIASGNHEQSIKRRHETDLAERLCTSLTQRTGFPVYHGGYQGFVRFRFHQVGSTSGVRSLNLHYSHGYGGGGPVTKSLIQNNRRAVYLPDAHILVNGHIHSHTDDEMVRLRLRGNGVIEHESQWHLSIPTYKEEFGRGDSGWHARRGAPPKPIGAKWVRFYYQDDSIKFDVIKAQ